MVATLPQLPLLPFCDREHRNPKGGKRRHSASTLPEALVFLPSKTETLPPLAAVISTNRGRDVGRRDLAVYGVTSPSVSVQPSARVSSFQPTALFSADCPWRFSCPGNLIYLGLNDFIADFIQMPFECEELLVFTHYSGLVF